jgi:hypothetical protein
MRFRMLGFMKWETNDLANTTMHMKAIENLRSKNASNMELLLNIMYILLMVVKFLNWHL